MSRQFVCASAKFGLVAVAWLVISTGTSMAASVVVMDSSVAGVKNGQELTDDQQVDIPSGDHLLVAAVQNGQFKQIDIKGPRSGKVKDLVHPESTSASLWQLFRRLLQTGGATQGGIAASRGVRLTFNDVPIHGDISVCVEEGSVPRLALGTDSETTSVRLSDNQGTQSATINLASGSAGAPWPSAMPLKDGDVYRIMEPNSPQVEVKVHMVPQGTLGQPVSLTALQALEGHGCEQQASAILRQTFPR
jgi:hypothetical protein